MSAGPAKAALAMALFIVIASTLTLLWQTPGTAEFVVSAMSLAVGLIFTGVVVLVARRGAK